MTPAPDQSDRYVQLERLLAWPMLALSLLLIPILLLPMAWPGMPSGPRTALTAADLGIWVAFTVEYIALFVLALDRRRYVRTHLLELALVLLPMLRPLRVVRVARAARIARLGLAAGRASRESRRRLVNDVLLMAPVAAVLIAAFAAALVLQAERAHNGANITNYGDAMWWALTTITTVGYGDHYPITAAGRAVAGVLMIVGVAALGLVTASVAAAFVRWTSAPEEEIVEAAHAEQAVELADVLAEVRALRAEVAEFRAASS